MSDNDFSFGMTVPFKDVDMNALASFLPYKNIGMLPFDGSFASMMKAIMADGGSLLPCVGADGTSMVVVDRADQSLGYVVFFANEDSIDVMSERTDEGRAFAKRVTGIMEAWLSNPDNIDPGDPGIDPTPLVDNS